MSLKLPVISDVQWGIKVRMILYDSVHCGIACMCNGGVGRTVGN